ncbi:MAG: tripartite tricarboxylate transporter substrate binding protein [Betaproteobacteria bacterium]|nr:tripartite tricarboxylate transporter substrate binding protein [Betaproteobacteria bacterium]
MANVHSRFIKTLGVLAVLFPALTAAQSPSTGPDQAYPTKPVRLIVPFPPGGSNDIVGRIIGNELTGKLVQQVVIDNRGGAGGMIGSEIAASSQPDGYTLLIISVAYAYNPSIFKSKLKFDPAKAFTPVSLLGTGPNALTINPKLPVKSVKELIAMAKAKPGALNYASAGIGSFQHLGTEMFRLMAGINIVNVPFKGGGPAMADVVAGNTQISIGSLIQAMPFIKNGRLKVLAIGSAKRTAAMPEIPTIAEAGVPGYEASNWWGIVAPAGTPAAIVKRLHAELAAILGSQDIRKRFESQGAETVSMTSAEFGKFIRAETVKWARVVQEAGIRAE